MAGYDPFSSSSEVFRGRRPLPYNPFTEQESRKRNRPPNGAAEDREQAAGTTSESASTRHSSAPREGEPKGPRRLLDRPPPHSDVVMALVDMVLEQSTEKMRSGSVQSMEIEAKLGTMFDKASGSRVGEQMPVFTESALRSVYHQDMKFNSTVSVQAFKVINTVLNEWVRKTGTSGKPILCQHVVNTDIYYEDGTRESTGEDGTSRVIRKKRLGDLNVPSPMARYDVRYSLSLEEDTSKSAGTAPRSERKKDRQSYRFSNVVVDITAVVLHEPLKQEGGKVVHVGVPQRSYEVEIELVFPKGFDLAVECKQLRQRRDAGEAVTTSKLHELIQELTDVARGVLTATTAS